MVVSSLSTASYAGGGIMNSSAYAPYMSGDRQHPSILSEELVSVVERDPTFVATYMFRLPQSCGRVQATLRMKLSSTVEEVRAALHKQQKFQRKPETLEFWLDGAKMDMKRTMQYYSKASGNVGLIIVRGGNKDVAIEMAGVPCGFTMMWSVHLTLTGLLANIYERLKKTCGAAELVQLHLMRLSHDGRALPIERCYHQFDHSASDATTLSSLGFGRDGEPCTVQFKVSRGGRAEFYALACMGETTVGEVKELVAKRRREDEVKANDEGWVAGVLRPSRKPAPSVPWDDVDETVSPCGVHTVYVYRPENPDYVPSPVLDKAEAYLSFHPPVKAPPVFISIEDDYTVPHLSDLGIFPGTALDLSFYSPNLNLWSHDLPVVPCDDSVSVVIRKGAMLRLPVAMNQPLDHLYLHLWAATGIPSQHSLLMTDEGRVVHRSDTMNGLELLPETVLAGMLQPKSWEVARDAPGLPKDLD